MKKGETLDEILGIKVLQKERGYRVSVDPFLLASFVLPLREGERVLDVGTGYGVIPLFLAKRSGALFTAIEIQEEVYQLALRNVELNNLSHRIELIKGDFRDVMKDLPEKAFDLVLANPPYRKTGASRPSPYREKAIAHLDRTWDMECFFEGGKRVLKETGRMALLYHTARMAELLYLAMERGLSPRRMRIVYPKEDGRGELFLVEFRKREGPLSLEPPLFIEKGLASLSGL